MLLNEPSEGTIQGEGGVENKVLEWRAFNAEMLLNEPSEGTIQGANLDPLS